MKYIVDILKQFTVEQRFAVLVFILLVMSLTYILTTYIKSDSKSCSEVIELNKKYVKDFVVISNMIREERMKNLQVAVVDTASFPVGDEVSAEEDTISIPVKVAEPEINIMDSILSITESNTKE
jgi:hypothetical protein